MIGTILICWGIASVIATALLCRLFYVSAAQDHRTDSDLAREVSDLRGIAAHDQQAGAGFTDIHNGGNAL